MPRPAALRRFVFLRVPAWRDTRWLAPRARSYHDPIAGFDWMVTMRKLMAVVLAGLCLGASTGAQANESGLWCVVHMTVGGNTYYAPTGTPIVFANWVRGAVAADVPRFEAFIGRHYRGDITTQNADPASNLFDGLTLQRTSCHPATLSGQIQWARSWGNTNRGFDASLMPFVSGYQTSRALFIDDRVDFAVAIKDAPKSKPAAKPEPPKPQPNLQLAPLVIESKEPTAEQKAAQAAKEAERKRAAPRTLADDAARQAANDAEAKAQRAAQLERERKRRLECPSLNCQ
jgi:hypothetical protein